jgi:type I restriction enzyme, S subunit
MDVKPDFKQTETVTIPEDWQLRPMLSVVRVANGQVDPKIDPYRSMILVAPDHIEASSGRLLKKETACDQRAISGKYQFAKGDIVYSKIRPYLRKAILADFDGLCSADMYPLKPVDDVSAGFIFAAVLGHHFSKYAEAVSVRSGMPKINRAELAAYAIALPPTKAEQEAIAGALSDADALIEALEQLLAKKRNLKQGAMQELLTGRKRLPGFEGEQRYKQSEAGSIPEDWRIAPVEQISTVGRGRVISHKEIARSFDPRYPVYSSQTSNDGVMGYLDTFEFEGEYITWTTDGANAGTVFYRNGRFNCTNVCGTIKLRSDNHLFVAKVLGTIAPRHVSRHLGNPKLMNDVMKRIKIPMPPTKAEQEAISAILSDIDAEIAALETKLAKASHLKQGMTQQLLTGRIRLV